MKLSTIIKFECLYNAKHIYNTLFFFLLIFQGIWYSTGFIDHIPNQNMMANAPAVAYGSLALMGIILFAVTPIIAAGSLARDLESGSAHIIYPAVIGEKKYFFGKYFGTLIVNFIVVLGYPLGILLFPLLGMGTPDQYGPMPIGQVLHAFLVLTVPNLIFLITFSIFLVVMFRRAAAAYLGVLLVFIILLVMLSVRNDTAYPLAVKLLEPFGCNCVEAIKENMDILQFNTAYLPISTPLFLNRLIWLTVSVLLFVVSLLRFNFKGFVALPGKTTKQEKVITESVMGIGNPVSLFLNYGTLSYHIRSVKFAMVNVRRIFTSPGFLVMLATLFFLFLGYNFLWTSTNYLTTSHLPLTYTMTLIRIPMMVVIGVMILILSGEVLFKDRISGLWTIVDAMPTPSWVLIISRFLTMGVVAFIIASLMFAAGVFAQCVMGFYGIEWGLYIRDLYGSRFGWVTSLQLISLAFFCGAFFNNRLKGHIVSIVIFIFIVMSVDQQLIEQQHLAFTIVPAALGPEMFNYSEMNGYGVLDTGMLWYAGAWTTLAVLFILLSVFLWNRGVDRSWKERWQTVKQRLGTSSGKGLGTAMICCLLLFGCFQYIIHDNLIHKAGYQTKIQKEEEAAAYEKKYARYRETRQPKITNLDLQLDLFPARRQAEYTARLVMKNTTSQPMETLHLDWDRKLAMSSLSADGHSLEKLEQDKKLRHAIYRMQPPLKAGESMNIEIVGSLAHRGFHQSDFQGDLTYNGSVLATDFLPFFGYDRSRELDNNKKRLRQGLALLTSRIDDRDNGFSRANLFESVQSDGLSWDMVISTDADQTVVGPGKLVKRWQDKGRNYARFQSASAGKIDFKIISARFAVKRLDCDGLGCVLFYHPQHTYNIAVFAEALQKIVPWFSGLLGSYPYKELRVVEKPFYDSDFLTFANVQNPAAGPPTSRKRKTSSISICIWQKSLPDNGSARP